MARKSRNTMRVIRHKRIRKKIAGTVEKPRLAVYKSLRHISAQIIDDTEGRTLAAASSLEKDLKAAGSTEGAKLVGKALAERAKKAGITQVVFDRGGSRYAGRIASLADACREGGLEF